MIPLRLTAPALAGLTLTAGLLAAPLDGPALAAPPATPAGAAAEPASDPCAEGRRLRERADFLSLREQCTGRFGLVGAPPGAAAHAYEQAEAVLAALLESHPALAEAWLHLGACQLGRGRLDLARATLARLERLDPVLARQAAADLAVAESRQAGDTGEGC